MSKTELQYREISSQRAINDVNFSQGVIDFNFSTGAPTGWIPNQSYFRIEMKITGEGGNQPTVSQQIAFADSACGNLFDNV